MHPPHLPKKTFSFENKVLWQRLKWLAAIVVFGLVVGMSGAAMMVGWVWPKFAEGDAWITSSAHPGLTRAQLEDRVREEASLRMVNIYKGLSSLSGAGYLNKKIGDGIILSSDGWLAVYQPNYDGNLKSLYVITSDDRVWQPEKGLLDKYSGMLYLKIKKDDQFKVISFNDDSASLDDIFTFHNSFWYHGSVLYPFLSYQIPHLDSAPVSFYSLNGSFNAGEVAINSQGRVVGFITEKNLLLPSSYITRVLPKILSLQTISYPSLGVDGWFGDEQTIVSEKTKVQGFMVSDVWSAASLLRRGDVVLEINGRIVSADNLWYTIDGNQTVNAKVLRNGKRLELTLKVLQTK
ncbi:MAG TPA: S1C family serine protease [Candidatus Udaeobacter sp.]|nr:S1C family serine protease [Candidatus Udaeobacter sp.]